MALRLAESDAVDDRGVVQGVRDHGVFGAQTGLKEPRVGIEAAREEDRVLRAVEVADRGLQLLVHVLK